MEHLAGRVVAESQVPSRFAFSELVKWVDIAPRETAPQGRLRFTFNIAAVLKTQQTRPLKSSSVWKTMYELELRHII